MKKKLLVAGLLGASAVVFPLAPASAGIDSCGNINVEARAECTVEVEGGCEAQCTPIAFQAACAGELEVDCRGECNVEASVQCTGSCSADCVAECNVNPPSFECSADCNARADATCSAECQASNNRGECTASCKATYSAECDASCEGQPGSASCAAKCEASCEADCTAQANVDCQVDCQSEGYVECKARLEGGCEVQCREPEGALFCDGQYVDHGDNLQECIAAINAIVDVQVDATGSASGSCENGGCAGTAEGQVTSSCALGSRASSEGSLSGLFAVFAALGLVSSRRRRQAR